MLFHDDVVYQILQWLPVMSLLRFKLVCRTWRALIESNNFIKQHLHLHHYDPKLKDKTHNLIYQLRGKGSSITFAITSTEGFNEPNVCLQPNSSDLHGYFAIKVVSIVSYNGIICLNLLNRNREQSICLWNPATQHSRVIPQSIVPNKVFTTVGFGFDVKSNDYKVVNLIKSKYTNDNRVEVYSLNTASWRSVTTVFPFIGLGESPRMPFNNGTCFFWLAFNDAEGGILCFDFCSEMFRSISGPCADSWLRRVSVVNDKIACVNVRLNDHTEMWVFNEYGTVNESWTKLYTITYPILNWRLSIQGISMNGNYIFFKTREQQMGRFNVVTKETTYFSLEKMPCSTENTLVEFKESLISVLDA